MEYYGTSALAPRLVPTPSSQPKAGHVAPVFTVAAPQPMTAVKVLGELVLGVATLGLGLVASFVVLLTYGSYDGDQLTSAEIRAAHHGQLALLAITLWVSVPWLATAAQRRPTWRLQAAIGVVVGLPSLAILAGHLHPTDWVPLFQF